MRFRRVWQHGPRTPAGGSGVDLSRSGQKVRAAVRTARCGSARSAPSHRKPPVSRGTAVAANAAQHASGTGRRSRTTTTCRTSSTSCCSTPHMAYSCGVLDPGPAETSDYTVARRAGRQARPDLPQARVCATRDAPARHRLRMGVVGPACSPALRRARHRGHPVQTATGLRRQARIAEREASTGRVEVQPAGLPRATRRRGALRRGCPRSRWVSTSASSSTRRMSARCSACLQPTGRLLIQQMSHKSGSRKHLVAVPFIESYIAPDMHMRPLVGQTRGVHRAGRLRNS